jgi:hypothetical protein
MDPLTKSAISATLHCLTGCAIGEVLGMVLGTALDWHNAATTVLSILLAFFFGYMFTLWPILKAGVGKQDAMKITIAADTASITSMEIIDNAFIWVVPGAVNAALSDSLFWVSLAASLIIAFILTVPLNRWLIARGRGHAVAHEYHKHHDHH